MTGTVSYLTERSWQRTVLDYARMRGWTAWHDTDSRRNTAGLPDLLLVRERVVWAELKSEKGRVRPEQVRWLERLAAAGQEVWLWRPSDWQQVERTLR